MKRSLTLILFVPLLFAFVAAAVEVRRLPEGAMQPIALTDDGGTVHLVWLQGDPKAADVFYQKLPGGRTNGTPPVRVNRQAGSAIAIGTVRGAQLAIGRGGRVHVVWNGSSAADPKSGVGVPLFYARSDDSGNAFEAERNLLGRTAALDGGAAVAADRMGGVFVVWHAAPDTARHEESARRVFLAGSTDDGGTFAAERAVDPPNGACGCCGLRAAADPAGNLLVLYRSAAKVDQRDATLLVSRDHAASFATVLSDPWPTGQCPMSTAAFASGATGASGGWVAWETRGQVLGSFASAGSRDFAAPVAFTTKRGGKHPALAVNARGEALAAWAEGTGWQKGGDVAWRTLDARGRPTGEVSVRPGLPVWSFPAVFSRDDGDFVVVF